VGHIRIQKGPIFLVAPVRTLRKLNEIVVKFPTKIPCYVGGGFPQRGSRGSGDYPDNIRGLAVGIELGKIVTKRASE
jgi:hypothetical protein